jgi:hypothetical protein
MAGRGEGIVMRFHHNGLLDQLAAWIANQPWRPKAIRRLLAKGAA